MPEARRAAISPITPGRYPVELTAACRMLGLLPADLHDWAVRRTTVTLVLHNGRKIFIPLDGDWKPAQRAEAAARGRG